MFFFLPIGQERELRRRPWVTVVIVALCLLVQIYQDARAPDPEVVHHEMTGVLQEIVATPAVDRGAARRLAAIIDRDPRAAFQSIASGEVPGVTPETQRRAVGVVEKIDRDLAADLTYAWADRPDAPVINLLLSLFVHVGWLHLLGNMLFLWVCGPAVEDRWGHGLFAACYFVGGVLATLTFRALFTGDRYALVGASGAISAAMGAFLICFAHTRLRVWYRVGALWFMRRSDVFSVAAWIPLTLWFGLQLLATLSDDGSMVAYSAHVGGFLAGAGVAYALRRSGLEKRHLLTDEYVDEEEELEATRKRTDVDDDLELALDYARSGNRTAAIGALKALLRKRPQHVVARRELVYLSLDDDREEARQHCSQLLLDTARDGHDDVIALYQSLEKHGVHAALVPRALAEVARAATSTGKGPLAVGLTKHLLSTAPHLPAIPALLWEVALMQEREGRQDLADRTLQMLLQRYAGDPVSDQARQRLAARWAS